MDGARGLGNIVVDAALFSTSLTTLGEWGKGTLELHLAARLLQQRRSLERLLNQRGAPLGASDRESLNNCDTSSTMNRTSSNLCR